MDKSSENLVIIITSFGSFILFCCCFKYCRDNSREKIEKIRSLNMRNKLVTKNRIKPIDVKNDEEVKDELEQCEIRRPQITGEENV